jgi:hypothetical protein
MRPVIPYGVTGILDQSLDKSYMSKFHSAEIVDMKMTPGQGGKTISDLQNVKVTLEVSCHALDPRTLFKLG